MTSACGCAPSAMISTRVMVRKMAIGSLVLEGNPVRFTGEDTRRGTFSQRHAALIDYENEVNWIPLGDLPGAQANFWIYDSLLSEYAALGYEYGYAHANHDALEGRLHLGLNLMASRVNNTFAPVENGGGFLGGLFTNMVIYNPTFPVRRSDGNYFESGCAPSAATCAPSALDVRNPVGVVEQLDDVEVIA